jgi:hypothetical protein
VNPGAHGRDLFAGPNDEGTGMLDIIVTALIAAFTATAILGHVLVFTALAYGADGLPKRWARATKRTQPTSTPPRTTADAI